jgi:2-dehydro-3-deoxyphosphooctonate aldolase (KDO 8-P synthase)
VVQIGSIEVGEGGKLLLIAGPCQIESQDHTFSIASFLVNLCRELPVSLVFKSSFDKANRTSLAGARGIGLEEGLKILAKVRSEFGCPVLTDVHSAEQAVLAATSVDALQIPAFLCRQTDLLVAAGRTGKAVHIKKGQFLPRCMHFDRLLLNCSNLCFAAPSTPALFADAEQLLVGEHIVGKVCLGAR